MCNSLYDEKCNNLKSLSKEKQEYFYNEMIQSNLKYAKKLLKFGKALFFVSLCAFGVSVLTKDSNLSEIGIATCAFGITTFIGAKSQIIETSCKSKE